MLPPGPVASLQENQRQRFLGQLPKQQQYEFQGSKGARTGQESGVVEFRHSAFIRSSSLTEEAIFIARGPSPAILRRRGVAAALVRDQSVTVALVVTLDFVDAVMCTTWTKVTAQIPPAVAARLHCAWLPSTIMQAADVCGQQRCSHPLPVQARPRVLRRCAAFTSSCSRTTCVERQQGVLTDYLI